MLKEASGLERIDHLLKKGVEFLLPSENNVYNSLSKKVPSELSTLLLYYGINKKAVLHCFAKAPK